MNKRARRNQKNNFASRISRTRACVNGGIVEQRQLNHRTVTKQDWIENFTKKREPIGHPLDIFPLAICCNSVVVALLSPSAATFVLLCRAFVVLCGRSPPATQRWQHAVTRVAPVR